jgi:gamma-glutamyltranspeptidase/glutathione hydrolase/leukotriene-C4 hydrolase
MGRRTNIIFNNEMDDFSTPGFANFYGVPASPVNTIEPGKMAMSSMCPLLVANKAGDVILATGGTGGPRITTTIAYVSNGL